MGIADVKHVVILMQENRSFDEYFGTFPGVSGFADASNLFGNPWPGSNLFPFRLSTFTSGGEECPGCNHDWDAAHAAYAMGQMNGWNPQSVLTQNTPSRDPDNPPAVMGYYAADDIPYHWALAQTFALCDHYFCSVLGGTFPNRLYLMSGAIRDPNPAQEAAGNPGPFIYNPGWQGEPNPYAASWQSYADTIYAAQRPGISWRVYNESAWMPAWLHPPAPNGDLDALIQFQDWDNYANNPQYNQTAPQQFDTDAANGALPTISWIIPPYGATEWQKNHPADGAYYIALKLASLLSNAAMWESTVFIIVYDESDGHFDHVLPPQPSQTEFPDEYLQTPQGIQQGLPQGMQSIGAGFRVPAIIISPWTVGAGVQRDYFDHTSILQFLEVVTGVLCPNLRQGGWRRQTFGNLTSFFNFSNPVSAAAVAAMLPSTAAVLQWKANAEARLAGKAIPVPPRPQPAWPPLVQSCAANDVSLSRSVVVTEFGKEQAGRSPQPGGPGTATIQNVLTVVVNGFEPAEFIDKHAGYPQGVLANPNSPIVNGQPLQQPSRVPVVTVVTGANSNELTFTCTQMSADPSVIAAQTAPGVSQEITFTFAVTFHSPIVSFAFRTGTIRILGLMVSFTVDTTVTASARIDLTGGDLVVHPVGACAQLAEQILEAERALLAAQNSAPFYSSGNPAVIKALSEALAALQTQYAKYCGSGGSSGPNGSSGPIHLGGGG